MKKVVLEIKNLTKYYGNTLGVSNLSLNLNEGEIFGFIGPNGAGKSTTIRSIMNLINKTEGTVLFNGQELTRDLEKLKIDIGYLPSEIHLYGDLTVKEMLDFHESFYEQDIHKNRNKLVKLFKLDEQKKVENLSLGNLKKLGIVLAFMHKPLLLILDEPTSGLDPIMQEVFYQLLEQEKKRGATIFYSTHILNEVSRICDRVGIIKDGKLIAIESVDELNKNQLQIVTISSKEIDKITKDLKLDIVTSNNNEITFRNIFDSNNLIKKLSNYKIDKLLIKEAPLEDVFMHFYE